MLIPLVFLAAAKLGDLGAYGMGREYTDLPRDVRVFIDRRMGCNHFGGEEAYDEDRARELRRAFRKLRCGSLATDEAALRSRYANKPEVLHALTQTRDDIW